jgi:hypothetical protein
MIQYLRIPKSKFWGWVFTSLAVGLLLGGVVTWVISRTSYTRQIDDLRLQLASEASQAASAQQTVQSRLDSADASLTALSQQYEALKASNEAAKAKSVASSQTASTAPLEVLSRTITPSTISTGDYITMRADVQGAATRVTMRIVPTSGGTPYTYSLKKVSSSGSKSSWKRVVSGPKVKGTYHYYATAYSSTSSATMPGAKPSTLKVQ